MSPDEQQGSHPLPPAADTPNTHTASDAGLSEAHPLDGLLEPDALQYDAQVSIAISLKRIADVLQGSASGIDFLQQLAFTLADASHDHAQRMGR